MTRNGVLLEGMKTAMLQQNEVALQQEMARTEREQSGIESSLERLSVHGDDSGDSLAVDVKQSKEELLEEMRQQKASNEALRKTCEEAISKLVYERTGNTIKIKGTRAKDHSTALAGWVNTLGEGFKPNLDISDTTADGYSFAGAGVIMDLDFGNLRQGTSADIGK